MQFEDALKLMKGPSDVRPSKPYLGGVIQIMVTRACNLSCYNCTQGSNLGGKSHVMTPEQFEMAVDSLKGYWGVFGVFGGNPAMSPYFAEYCEILKRKVPQEQCGLWCNHPRGKGRLMQGVFNPKYSNLNVHLDREAYDQFKRDWPESMPFGLTQDSRHSPPFVAMKDVILQDQGDGLGVRPWPEKIWELASACDINQNWSALIGVFRGELRAWFCEVAGAQAMLHQDDPDYPDTGVEPSIQSSLGRPWWAWSIQSFSEQVKKHCQDCGVPLRGYGELSQRENGTEQVSRTHEAIYKPKKQGRKIEVVVDLVQLGTGRITTATKYLQNGAV